VGAISGGAIAIAFSATHLSGARDASTLFEWQQPTQTTMGDNNNQINPLFHVFITFSSLSFLWFSECSLI
jgi:hypothetical protein